jgi:hypothetical protein
LRFAANAGVVGGAGEPHCQCCRFGDLLLKTQHQRLVVVLEVAGVEAFVRTWPGLPGRPLKDRHALARSFVAKVVFGLATTAALIERLAVDRTLRRLCGRERAVFPARARFRAPSPNLLGAGCRAARMRH